MRLIVCIAAILFLAGCLTEKKRGDIFHRYAREHRSEILEYCPPPKDTFKPGKPDTVVKRDTLRVRVPYAVPGTNDTIWVPCPDTETITKYVGRVDTLWRDNSAELLLMSAKLSESEKQLSYTQGELDRLESERNRWRTTSYVVIGSIILVLIVRIWLKSKIPIKGI